MSHVVHDFDPNSPEWANHRRSCFNASEAAAMLGMSSKVKRNELLHMKITLSDKEFSDWVQKNIIDPGHEFEEAARPFAEEIIGEELFRTTCSLVVDGLPLSASYDGHTMTDEITWEHKRLNKELEASLRATIIPDENKPQLEQQLLVKGAKRCLFMASDGTPDNVFHCWYESDPTLRAMLIAGWKQFAIDLETYVPTEEKAPVVARPVTELPAVSVQVKGSIEVADNFKAFEAALRHFIDNQLIKEPQTDQDFADLDLQIKALQKAEDALDTAEAMMLAQVSTINDVKRIKDMLHALARTNRLASQQLLKTKKESIRSGIILGAQAAWKEHVDQINKTLGRIMLPVIQANFAEVIKNKRTLESLQNAVDTELARVKIEANRIADQIRLNLASLNELAADYKFLFMDAQQLVGKANEDLVSLIKVRIAEHKAAEQKKAEAVRETIRQEERAKAEKEAREKLEREQKEERERVAAAEKPVEVKAVEPIVEQRQAPVVVPAKQEQSAPQRTPVTTPQVRTRPSDAEFIQLVMDHYQVDRQTAIDWLMAFQFKAVG